MCQRTIWYFVVQTIHPLCARCWLYPDFEDARSYCSYGGCYEHVALQAWVNGGLGRNLWQRHPSSLSVERHSSSLDSPDSHGRVKMQVHSDRNITTYITLICPRRTCLQVGVSLTGSYSCGLEADTCDIFYKRSSPINVIIGFVCSTALCTVDAFSWKERFGLQMQMA